MPLVIRAVLTPILLCTLVLPSMHAQPLESESDWNFLPGGLLFPPLTANPQEPRMGLRKEIGSSRMRLEIGSTIDILEFSPSDSDCFHLGFSFFTYGLTTSNQGLRLQVDAVDGFFGGHVTYKKSFRRSAILARLRILHVSAHFVDGHFDSETNSWKDGIAPIPFTKDFGEFIGAFNLGFGPAEVMVYGGGSYATLVRPEDIQRFSGLAGLEIRSRDDAASIFGKPLIPFAAYNLSLSGVPTYVGTNTVEGGLKFGRWNGNGVRIYASYHHGLAVFGQYYNSHQTSWSLGFAFDAW